MYELLSRVVRGKMLSILGQETPVYYPVCVVNTLGLVRRFRADSRVKVMLRVLCSKLEGAPLLRDLLTNAPGIYRQICSNLTSETGGISVQLMRDNLRQLLLASVCSAKFIYVLALSLKSHQTYSG